MFEEVLMSSILQASITGAGLILAVFALIIPIAPRILRDRLDSYKKTCDDISDNVKENRNPKELKLRNLQDSVSKLSDLQTPLDFSNGWVKFSFLLYIASSILSGWWLSGFSPTGNLIHIYVLTLWMFGGATLSFAWVGYNSLNHIFKLLERDYKIVKEDADKLKKKYEVLSEARVVSPRIYTQQSLKGVKVKTKKH